MKKKSLPRFTTSINGIGSEISEEIAAADCCLALDLALQMILVKEVRM